MKQDFFAVDFDAMNGYTILRPFIQGGLNFKEINRFPNHLLNTRIEMIKLFHILFAVACIGSILVYSHQFTEYILCLNGAGVCLCCYGCWCVLHF